MKAKIYRILTASVLASPLSFGQTIVNPDGFSTGNDNGIPAASRSAALGWNNQSTTGVANLPNHGGNLMAGSANSLLLSDYSVVLGSSNSMERQSASLVLGSYNELKYASGTTSGGGEGNILIGDNNKISVASGVSWNNILLLGSGNSAVGSDAWVFGMGNVGQSQTVTLGTYALSQSGASLLVGTGTGTGSAPRSNGLEVYKDGRVIIPGNIMLGSSSGIYFGGNSTATLQAAANGSAIFPSKALFENGADFGNGNTLNASNVQFLKTTLGNLGYSDTPSNATVVSGIKCSGNVNINQTTTAGNFLYVAGYFSGNASIGGVPLYCYSGNGAFFAKCASDGTVIWAKYINASNYCAAQSIAVNSAGSLALVGCFCGTTSGLGNGKEMTSVSPVAYDGFVLGIDSNGSVQWAKAVAAGGCTYLKAVAIAGNGTVAAGGQFQGTTSSLGGSNVTSAGSWDAILLSYASNGNLQWAKAIGGLNTDLLNSISIGSTGNVTASGYFCQSITNMGAFNKTGMGWEDGYVVQCNPTGQVLWLKAIGGPNSSAFVSSQCQDVNDNIIVVGNLWGTTTTLESGKNISASGSGDGFVAMLNSSGTTQWARAIGGSGYDCASAIALDNAGKIIVAGSFGGATTNLGAGFDIAASGGANDTDIFILRLDPANGGIMNAKAIGGSSNDSTCGISCLFPSGMMYLTGYTQAAFSLGNTRVVPDRFTAGWQGFNLVTPAATASASLSWSGGLASGTGSTAIGNKAFASGSYSAALGDGAATGDESFAAGSSVAKGLGASALGHGNRSTGDGSSALGDGNTADGSDSVAIGGNNYASSNATAIGYGNDLCGAYSASVGYFNYVEFLESYAYGEYNMVQGPQSMGLGFWNTTLGNYAIALGCSSTAQGDFSMALGTCLTTGSYMQTAVGIGNLGIAGNKTSWVETDPLFEAGNSSDWGSTPSNAITTLKNGQTTLTNKAWKADPTVAGPINSNGQALVVEGHADLKGNTVLEGNAVVNGETTLKGKTVLQGKVVIEQAQGDISMGDYQ